MQRICTISFSKNALSQRKQGKTISREKARPRVNIFTFRIRLFLPKLILVWYTVCCYNRLNEAVSNGYPRSNFRAKKKENITNLYLKSIIFTAVKNHTLLYDL